MKRTSISRVSCRAVPLGSYGFLQLNQHVLTWLDMMCGL